jgi:actin-like ATPase involved in cell morphogenesis
MASHSRARADAAIADSKPVDHPDRETVEVRQGTGPRGTVTVLIVSLAAAAAVGALLLIFFYAGNT